MPVLIFVLFSAFIEKNTWSGLEDFYSNLSTALQFEISTTKTRKSRRRAKSKKINKSLPMCNSGINGNNSNGEIDEETEDNSASTNGK